MGKKKGIAAAIQRVQHPADAAMHNNRDTDETDALFDSLRNIGGGNAPTAIVPREGGAMELKGWQMTATGLIPPDNIAEQEYRDMAARLLLLDNSMQWFLGDFAVIGDDRQWGETYRQLAEDAGKDWRTIEDWAYVCRNVKISERSEKLSFNHHKLVAKMQPDEQRAWLSQAVDEGLSIAKLRAAIKAFQLTPPNPAPIPPVTPSISVGDTVQTEHNGTGVVQQVNEKVAFIQTSAGTVVEEVAALQSTQSANEPAALPETGATPDAYDAARTWDEATGAWEFIRAVDMDIDAGRSINIARRRTAREDVRALIAHLHFIESRL